MLSCVLRHARCTMEAAENFVNCSASGKLVGVSYLEYLRARRLLPYACLESFCGLGRNFKAAASRRADVGIENGGDPLEVRAHKAIVYQGKDAADRKGRCL